MTSIVMWLHVGALLVLMAWQAGVQDVNRRMVREVRYRGNFTEVIAWQRVALRHSYWRVGAFTALASALLALIETGVYR